MNTEPESGIGVRAHRRQREREAILSATLAPDETVIARGAVMVTDRRVLFAWRGLSAWHSDAISFEEIRRWALGRLHDERPVVRIEHPTRLRIEHVPAHRLLRFAWGNAETEVPHDDVTFIFGSKRDPSFQALIERLEQLHVRRGEDFAVALPGRREERQRRSHAYLERRR